MRNKQYSRTKTPRLYNVWRSMKKRCNLKTHDYYYRYGGRGIGICEEWYDFPTFAKWAYENGYDENAPKGKCTLDRIDNNSDYEPNNCRWVTSKKQQNNKCDSALVEFEGEVKTIAEWQEELNLTKTQRFYMYHLKRKDRSISDYLHIVKYNPEKLKSIHLNQDYTGQKFGKLTVLGNGEPYVSPCGNITNSWICKCDCGTVKTIRRYSVKSGRTVSCGCHKRRKRGQDK